MFVKRRRGRKGNLHSGPEGGGDHAHASVDSARARGAVGPINSRTIAALAVVGTIAAWPL